MENKDNKFLGEEKISKLLLKFAIPCILSMLISSLYNIVDQIFIGNSDLGYLGNAATSIVFPITVVAVAFAWCFGDGAAAFLSLSQGRNDTKNTHKAIGNGILMNLLISIIFVILGFIFMDELLYSFGASDITINIAKDYFRIILIFIPAYMMGNMMSSIIRADGSPGFSMVSTLSGAIINIILDPIFIFGCNLGIKGAAWATIIGQVVSLIIAIVYFTRTKTFKLCKESFKLDLKLFSNVVKLGISTFITQMSVVVISLVCNMMLSKYGATSKYGSDIPIAAIGICMKVFSIIIGLVVGTILGAQPILGYNIGAKKIDRVKQTFKLVLSVTIVVGVIATIIFEFCPSLVIKIFGSQSDLYMEFAILTFRIFLLLVLFTSIMKTISIFFQAVGKPIQSILVSLLRDILFFVPLVIILPKYMGIKGVLWASPIADSIGMIISTILIIIFFKNLNKKQETREESAIIQESTSGVIITIAREHGTQGKSIGELVAQKLNIPYYYKELTALVAKESGLDKEFISEVSDEEDVIKSLYLTTTPAKYAIEAQEKVIKKIASNGSCVIVGRAADYVLRDNKDLVRIFIYANKDYKVENIMKMYNDTKIKAKKNIEKSDRARSNYYKLISGKSWKDNSNYDLCIDSSIGKEKTAEIICNYINTIKNK